MVAPSRFKNLVVADEVQSDSRMANLASRGSDALVEVLGESSPLVEVCWGAVRDNRNRPLVELRLRDWNGEVVTRFESGEYEDESRFWRRLYSAWGDLLQIQSAHRVREMREAVGRLDELDAAGT